MKPSLLFLVLAISSALGQDGRNCHIERWTGAFMLLPQSDGWNVADDLRIVCNPVSTAGFGGGDECGLGYSGTSKDTPAERKRLADCLKKKEGTPEPMDIPATYERTKLGEQQWRLKPTCPSGSGRVLLTDIDGGKHCILFPK